MYAVTVRRIAITALTLVAMLWLAASAAASSASLLVEWQPSPPVGQQPVELARDGLPLDEVGLVTMPPVDNAVLITRERQRLRPGMPLRFAEPITVNLTPTSSGTWDVLADGTWRWRLRIRSPKAVSLNLGFTRYVMPAGGQLWLYTPDRSTVIGPFTEADNESHGQLWTPILEGDEVVIEVRVPATAVNQLKLTLGRVNHGFLDLNTPLSGACNVDVACGAADGFPQVEPWRDQIRSVGAYTIAGIDRCSGALINNTAQDMTPYFLTANHCLSNPDDAPSVVVYWNYQNSYCRQPGSPASGGPGDGQRTQFNSGATLVATYDQSDFTLLKLDDPINPGFDLYWAGYDARDQATTSAVTIHHPGVEEKRISFENDPTSITTYLSNTPDPHGTHLRVGDWDLGTTEPGSSGSPLFSPEQRIVGQLTGGFAACGNDLPDWFGRLAVSWDGGGTADSRLRDWLDPVGQGNTLVLDGRYQGDFKLQAVPLAQSVCAPAAAIYDVTVIPQPGFTKPVSLTVAGYPSGTLATFVPDPAVSPGYTSTLTISNTASATPGAYTMLITGTYAITTARAAVDLHLANSRPSSPTLASPADGAVITTTSVSFAWQPVTQAATYTIQVAVDISFTHDVMTATVSDAGYDGFALDTNTTYFWRVRASNACGLGPWSVVARFTTAPGPGECAPGLMPNVIFEDDLESETANWNHNSAVGQDTWTLSSNRSHSGHLAFHATDVSTASDQLLISGPIALPDDQRPLSLHFWNWQQIESGSNGCYDGALLEISTDQGATWTQLDDELLTDPYDGSISSQFGNPLAGRAAWCGDPQDWLKSVVDLSAYAGQTVRFRFRLATDTSVSREGWYIDDVRVQSCRLVAPHIAVTPAGLEAEQVPDSLVTTTLTINNTGDIPLNWSIAEAPAMDPAASSALAPAAVPEATLPITAPCAAPADLNWLTVAPISGTTAANGTALAIVTFDSEGYGKGVYEGVLCISSNDPLQPLVTVPLTMTVVDNRRIFLPLAVKP